MGQFYSSEIHGSYVPLLIGLVFRASLSSLFPPLTVRGDIIWLEPPPFETVTDASSIYRTTKQSIQGSLNEELSCNFSLTADSSIISVSMKFRGRPAVTFVPNVLLEVEQVFAKHFNAVWVPNKLMLNLFNVTDAEEGEYSCEVLTSGRSARSWIRKIQLLVLDPSQAMVSSTTVPEINRIQTTVSAITASEDPSQTTDYPITASEVDVPWGIIGALVAVANAIAIAIAMVCFLKWRKRPEIHRDDQQGNEGVKKGQDGYAFLEPPAADGINGNQSKRDIQGKEEDTSAQVNLSVV